MTASFLDAEYDDYCNVALLGSRLDTNPALVTQQSAFSYYDVSGNTIAENPGFSGSLSPSYRGQFTNDWSWNTRLDIRHQGTEYLDAANVAGTSGYTSVNFAAGVSNESWQVTLYINNLTNEDTPLRYNRATDYSITQDTLALGPDFQANYLIVPRQERTLGLRVGFNF